MKVRGDNLVALSVCGSVNNCPDVTEEQTFCWKSSGGDHAVRLVRVTYPPVYAATTLMRAL